MSGGAVRELGRGRFLRLVERRGWEFVERPGVTGIVVLVAVTAEGELLLVEQHREALAATVVELPAGLVGDEGEERLEQAAARELEEETGFTAERFEELAAGPPSAGLSTEIVTFLRAHGLRRVGAGGGVGGEEIAVRAVPLAVVDGWLRARAAAGALVDPKVWTGLYFLARGGELP